MLPDTRFRLYATTASSVTANAEFEAPLPEAFSADAEFFRQGGLRHLTLVFEDKLSKVFLQRQILCKLSPRYLQRRVEWRGIDIADCPLYRNDHFIMVKGFGNVIDRTLAHVVNRRAQAGIAGHNNYRHLWSQADQFIAGAAGQAKVGNNQREISQVIALTGGFNAHSIAHAIVMSLEQLAQGGANNLFIFDD